MQMRHLDPRRDFLIEKALKMLKTQRIVVPQGVSMLQTKVLYFVIVSYGSTAITLLSISILR